VENVIQVDDDLAYNSLIESTNMEKAVLFDTHDEGEKACFSGDRGQLRAMQGVKRILDPKGGATALVNGNRFFSPANKSMRAMAFGVDVKDQLEQVQAALAYAEKEFHGKKAAHRTAKERSQAAVRELDKLDARFQKLNNLVRPQLEQKIQQLQHELSELQTEDAAVDTSEWEDELGRVKNEMEECEERLVDNNRTRAERQAEVKAKVQEKQNFEATARGLQDQQEKVENELSNLLREGQERQAAVEKAQKKVDAVKEGIGKLRDACENQLREVQTAEELARTYTLENLGPDQEIPMKVPGGKDKEYFKGKIKALKAHKETLLSSLPKGQRNVDEAMQRAVSAKNVYDGKIAGIKMIQSNQDMIEVDLKGRLKKWKKFRKSISTQTNTRFDGTLQKKGQSGCIEFDHQAKELHITVQKDNRDSQSQIENVKLLSGGERSYATLSLLVALGNSLECPFRVMDEFDVFMDVVSRKVALDQLIQEGLANKDRQFVFITPQDLSSVTPSPEVKIIKLQNPGRLVEGQATL
jgi:chromosome segregation ATPase